MKTLFRTALICAAACIATAPAQAAPLLFTLEFSASDFFPAAPSDPVAGSFTFSFDNAADIAPTASGLTTNSFTLAGLTPLYSYRQSSDILFFGSDPAANSCNVSASKAGFCTEILNLSTNPHVFLFAYSDGHHIFNSQTISLKVTNGAVPEPASWAMMIGGLGIAGAAMRRPRVRARPATA